MTNTILFKRSSVAGKVPLVTDLQAGEPSLNTADGKMFIKKIVGTTESIVEIGASNFTGDVTGSGSGSVALTLSNTGVTAGVYNNVQVDAKGRVLTGSNAAYLVSNQTITYTGDATGSGTTSVVLTLANSGVTAGTYESTGTHNQPFTIDAKGRITFAGTPILITPAWSAITSKPTTISGYGITDSYTKTEVDAKTWSWTSITGKPTTLAGYGITDAVNTNKLGAANGVATLGSDGKVPAGQLPSYVDDIIEGAAVANFPATGESGKIYVATGTGKVYRWSGSAYVEISASPGSTDAVPEGTTNLYFTAARAQAAVTTITGNAGTATKLQTARTIGLSGDATGSGSFDGSANLTIATTLTNSGVTAGTYCKVTVDAKGRATAGAALAVDDIPTLPWTKINLCPITLNGYGITDGMHIGDVIDGGQY